MAVFEAQASLAGLDDLVAGYLEAAEFTMDEEQKVNVVGWTRKAKARAEKEVNRFIRLCQARHGEDAYCKLIELYEEHYAGVNRYGYSAARCVGHDIWYVTQGHGVGFQDRSDHPDFNHLQDIARSMRSDINVWRTNNGWLNLE